jgi:hypothetical protein
VYDRAAKIITRFLGRLPRIRASLIVARKSVAADRSTASGRIARTLAIQGFGTLVRAVTDVQRAMDLDVQRAMDLKGQMLDNARADAPRVAACFQSGSLSCGLSVDYPENRKLADKALVAPRHSSMTATPAWHSSTPQARRLH